jgi:son of sevenless-like protein
MDLDSVPFADFSALDSARETNHNIVYWVKKAILECDHVDSRVERIRWMSQAAEECRKQRNYSSMFALIVALRSPDISSLTITQQRLSKKDKAALISMEKLMDWAGGHAEYRRALSSSKTAIPYMEIHLRDFYNLLARTPSTIEFEGHTMINFVRCADLAQSITSIIEAYKPPAFGSDLTHVAYLENQLRKIKKQSNIKEWCEQRSLYLRDLEARNYHNHVDELAAMGLGGR